jgi:copper resistance protein B
MIMKIYPQLFSASCLLALLASPLAQAQAACTPEHAAMGHCTLETPAAETPKPEAEAAKPEPAKTETPSATTPMSSGMACTPEHAAMGHCKLEEPKADKPKTDKTETDKTKEKPKAKKSKKAKKQAIPAEKAVVTEATPSLAANPDTACTPEHAAMGHCTLATPKELKSKPVESKPAVTSSAVAKPAVQPVRPSKPTTSCTPEHAAMGHCTLPSKPSTKSSSKAATQAKALAAKATPNPAPARPTASCTPEHAAMGHCSLAKAKPSPQVTTAVKPVTPVNNSCTPEHAAMGHCSLDSGLPVSDGSAPTPIPMPYHEAMDMNDEPVLTKVMIDRFEVRDTEHGKPVILEADAWFGKSIDKLWLKTDVEALDGEVEEAQLQVLYNRAISPFWDLQAGVRHDFKPAKRTWAALGVQGTAPYFIETKASAFFGEQGQAAISLSAEKEVMLTQKAVLIPELALNLYGKDDHELGVGSGLADLNLGLRLSYEIEREFAPYIGVNWSKKFGKTADMAEHHGEKTQDTQFLVGIKAWF